MFFFFDPSTPDVYTYCPTLSLHDALPILRAMLPSMRPMKVSTTSSAEMSMSTPRAWVREMRSVSRSCRSEAHTSELQSLMRNSYAVFCLNKTIPQSTRHSCTTTVSTHHHTVHHDITHVS